MLTNLAPEQDDLLALPFADASVESLSCMHTVEQVGLGRDGDPLDSDGDLKAIKELKRVLAPGGNLLFVVPTGRPKVVFNAHRIYTVDQIHDRFADLSLQWFSLVPDDVQESELVRNASKEAADQQHYGCDCRWFRRT